MFALIGLKRDQSEEAATCAWIMSASWFIYGNRSLVHGSECVIRRHRNPILYIKRFADKIHVCIPQEVCKTVFRSAERFRVTWYYDRLAMLLIYIIYRYIHSHTHSYIHTHPVNLYSTCKVRTIMIDYLSDVNFNWSSENMLTRHAYL